MKKGKKQQGSVIIAALGMLLLLAIIGWGLISTSNFLLAESSTKKLTSQAYYLADAGIQRATERGFEVFKGLNMDPGIMMNLETELNKYTALGGQEDELFGGSLGYKDHPYPLGEGSYEVEVVDANLVGGDSVFVTFRSIGKLTKNAGLSNKPVRMEIIATVRYYLAGTELADFAYFANNYGYMDDLTSTAGSVASNGYFRFNGHVNVAGGDRYKHCDIDSSGNYTLRDRDDDGGVYAGKAIVDVDGDGNTVCGDFSMKPDNPNKYQNKDKIKMPSLAQLDYYKGGALTGESNHKSAGERHGIYSYVPPGTKIYASDGTTLLHTVTSNDTDSRVKDNYIKVCDAVFGDGNSTYSANPNVVDPNGIDSVFEAFQKDPNSYVLSYKVSEDNKTSLIVSNVSIDPNASPSDPNFMRPDPNYPIKIYGQVVVTENVVIQGIIQGTGSIYAGSNIYCPDGLVYARPPTLDGNTCFRGFTGVRDGYVTETIPDGTALENAKNAQQNWLNDNAMGSADESGKTDIVGLFATENIILGNPTKDTTVAGSGANIINNNNMFVQNGTITVITDPNTGSTTTQNVDFNNMDEKQLGADGVTATRSKVGDEEYDWETNNEWDVSFYNNGNPSPAGGKNPSLVKSGAANPNMYTLSDAEYSAISTLPSNWYTNPAYDNYKRAVIPGSGEDLDGDGGYDGQIDIYDVYAFNPTLATNIRGGANWHDAFNLSSAQWGGNLYTTGPLFNLDAMCGKCFKGRTDKNGDPWFEDWAFQLDAIAYTNHVIAGAIHGDSNGSMSTRIETYVMAGTKYHDDRVVGGGESLTGTGCQIPLIHKVETLGWKEKRI